MNAAELVSRARTELIMDAPDYGMGAMRLDLVEDASQTTMATDGRVIKFNGPWVESQTMAALKFTVCHEVLHCRFLHPFKMAGKDGATWNRATDYAINRILAQDTRLQAPAGILLSDEYGDDWDSHRIYAKLMREKQDEQPEQGGQPGDDGPEQASQPGGVEPAPQGTADGQDGADGGMSEEDWAIEAEQSAAVAKKAGKLPAGMERAMRVERQPSQDWRALLAEFIANTIPSDRSWARPNRRFIASGTYLPGTVRENIGPIAVYQDTSGSMTQAELDASARELGGIVRDVRPECVHVVYCDTHVSHEQRFDPDDEIRLEARGGGGTYAQPAFDRIMEDEPPLCIVAFTDLDLHDRPRDPGVPVIWVCPGYTRNAAPGFGEVIHITL